MKIIYSEIFTQFPEITFGFSTKTGLDRKAPYFFNMSKSVGDDPAIVDTNRETFFNQLGLKASKVILQKQIHSDIINIVNRNTELLESDGMITCEPGIGLGVSAADCVPLFIYDKMNRIIAGVHSGWRGTREKILQKTVVRMKKEFSSIPENLFVFIGPCISVENYQVGEETASYFDKDVLVYKDSKVYLDLKKANFNMLKEESIPEKNIEISRLCTFNEDYLHSYRREGEKSGRALGVISINGGIDVRKS